MQLAQINNQVMEQLLVQEMLLEPQQQLAIIRLELEELELDFLDQVFMDQVD